MSADPRRIRSIAVTAEDAVSAYEASERSSADPVLRITPPFAGRMRARLHLGDPDDSGAIHVAPGDLFDPERLPAYPEPADTEAEIRADPELSYSTELHHDRHVQRVRTWREGATNAFVERLEIDTDEGAHEIEVKVLGAANP
ncbi:hypothetical protein [Halalkalicoccus jeotgali]|uniref:DUF8009 domain-containing protein n=1 Tax=Halalkalicoccus jeotgali (strain DSM 18796 / CECT 7217 / JCM 14584 / KCTC 4019 / B3) TaxID=795797 RepID=D8J2P5_HALJB|nr:hypothetical protein [Halalkalicoccus jeotgali]ADJ15002.1 hypothetical protein HacjB3_08085 [Halalkalicoccus jeotgali B3]ELY34982.1 hypothetical protein C497_14637 [Halalkalicoccus jeotgali B3]